MDFGELIQRRYSVRSYKTDPVEETKIEKILDAARLAPTAANRQAFQLVVLRNPGREDELKQIYNRDWFAQAPLVIAACGLPGKNWVRVDGKNYNDVDVAIVMDHIILCAASLGLGTCWIGAFDPKAARRILGLPADVEPVAFTPLGYAAGDPSPKKRQAIGDLVRQERW